MDFAQIRALLTEHFGQRLIKARAEMDKNGRLNSGDQAAHLNSAHFAQEALLEGWTLTPGEPDDRWVAALIERYDLSIQSLRELAG